MFSCYWSLNYLCLMANKQKSGDNILNLDDCNHFSIYLKCQAFTDLNCFWIGIAAPDYSQSETSLEFLKHPKEKCCCEKRTKNNIGLIATKLIFGVSDKERPKPVSLATKNKLENRNFACSKSRYDTF